MSNNNRVCVVDDFGIKEREIVSRVLEKYDINIVNITKARSAYKVETEDSLVCLKRMKHGALKSQNGSLFVEELFKIGFNNIPQYLKTSEGNYFVKSKNMIFYATEWIDGEECSLDEVEEAENCVKLLAKFHLASSKINIDKLKIKNNLKNWPQIFNGNIYDLEKFKKIIENKRLRNEFDNIYYKFIDIYIERGIMALKILNKSNYYLLSNAANERKTICHDSFYYQNILKKGEDYFIVDLDSILIDLHINDLGKILRRLMYKNEYQWDFSKAKLLIEAYNSENKLSKEEIEAMLALIVFPHKFWKLGNKRYVKHKNWSEVKYMHKLNKLVKYYELEQEFFDAYLNYIEEYV